MRIGCLGAATITPSAVILPASVRAGAVLQAVAARDPARAQAYAARFAFKRAETDYAALVAADDIDLVYNALPIHLHAPWSRRALEAGKHVLCEKPFAMNAVEAEGVLAAALASGRRVIEAFHARYHPAMLTLMETVASGAIGSLRRVEGRFFITVPEREGAEIRHLPETGGGAFMDLGCYPLGLTLQLLEAEPASVEAEAVLTARGVDESLTARLAFAGGVEVELSASMGKGLAFDASLRVIGETGEIRYWNPVVPHLGGRLTVTSGGAVRDLPVSRISSYTYQLEAVLGALESGEALPTEGEAILRQQRTLDAIYAAAGLRHLRFPESTPPG